MSLKKLRFSRKTLLVFLLGIVVGSVLMRFTYFGNYENSRAPITPKEDEMENWKLLVSQAWMENEDESKESLIYFAFRYPPHLTAKWFAGGDNFGVCSGSEACYHFIGTKRAQPGDMYVEAGLYWLGGGTPVDLIASSSTTLGGKEAVRMLRKPGGTFFPPEVINVEYRVANVDYIKVNKEYGFHLSCYYFPNPYQNLEHLCDQIASTLVFEVKATDEKFAHH